MLTKCKQANHNSFKIGTSKFPFTARNILFSHLPNLDFLQKYSFQCDFAIWIRIAVQPYALSSSSPSRELQEYPWNQNQNAVNCNACLISSIFWPPLSAFLGVILALKFGTFWLVSRMAALIVLARILLVIVMVAVSCNSASGSWRWEKIFHFSKK